MSTLRELGEDGLIDLIRSSLPDPSPCVELGIGDDAALVNSPQPSVVCADAMTEEIHFTRALCPAASVGSKLVTVNLSDLAAMGARPIYGLLTCAFPPELEIEWVQHFLRGLASTASLHGMSVIGGDLSGSPGPIALSLTAVGALEGDQALTRHEALAGDKVYVTGSLGSAALGLRALQTGNPAPEHVPNSVAAFHAPKARLDCGRELARWGQRCAVMDLSDGLVSDASRMARASGVDFVVNIDHLPLSDELRKCDQNLAHTLAATGGEDYQLLIACGSRPPIDCSQVGRVEPSSEKPCVLWRCNGAPVEVDGSPFSHFSASTRS